MPRVSTYLNFMGNTEAAFAFYKSVFRTEYIGDIGRMEGVPTNPDGLQLTDAEKQMIMHIELPILAGHVLMGTDMIQSMGHDQRVGNNVTINLEPDTLEETERLFDALSHGGTDAAPLTTMFWGATWGSARCVVRRASRCRRIDASGRSPRRMPRPLRRALDVQPHRREHHALR